MNDNQKVYAVLGAGSWGTALAILLAQNGLSTTLWGRDAALMKVMQQNRCNPKYLGADLMLPERLNMTSVLDEALQGANVVLVVTPCHYFRSLLEEIKPHIQRCQQLVWACKGLEVESGNLLHTVAEQILGSQVQKAVISGPNFAAEVAKGVPSATTVAGDTLDFANAIAADLHNDWFRAYGSNDMVGVQVAGALKNGLAIATGIADGLGFGANTRAALVTRGLQEVSRLGMSLGANIQTFMGLAGVGDLMMTCTDNQSRNRRFGLLLAKGSSKTAAAEEIGQVVEGVQSVRAAVSLARQQAIELPILEQVFEVLYQDKSPQTAVEALLARDQKAEI